MDVENLFRVIALTYKLPNTLKTEQAKILDHQLNKKTDLIAILPTGYGSTGAVVQTTKPR